MRTFLGARDVLTGGIVLFVWMDEKGVAHTAALPESTDVMAVDFRLSLDALVAAHHEEVEAAIEAAEGAIFKLDLATLATKGGHEFVDAVPPRELLRGRVKTTEDLTRALAGVQLRWRLDVVLALDDYVS